MGSVFWLKNINLSDGVNDYDVVNMKKVKEFEIEINKFKKKKNYLIIEMKW